MAARSPGQPAERQGDLFEPPSARSPSPAAEAAGNRVGAAVPDDATRQLAQQLEAAFGKRLHLGTSSWSFAGWAGLVWDEREYSEANLSRHGLAAYARHPLLRTVSLDRTFYRAIDAATYARLARQTPDDFRFVVKAPSEITDAVLRAADTGAPLQDNPLFLDPRRALLTAVQPAVEGLGDKLGALVFQISPLSAGWLRNNNALQDRFSALWRAVVPAMPAAALTAVELRDARMLTPRLISHLAQHGVRYCVGLHDRMPPMARQVAGRACERARVTSSAAGTCIRACATTRPRHSGRRSIGCKHPMSKPARPWRGRWSRHSPAATAPSSPSTTRPKARRRCR